MSLVEQFNRVLEAVDEPTATVYEYNIPLIIKRVCSLLQQREDLTDLIGSNTEYLTNTILSYHAQALLSQFHLKSGTMLINDLVWLYNLVASRGFSPVYFPIEMAAWQEAVGSFLDAACAARIQAVYQCIIDNHRDLLVLSQQPQQGIVVDETLVVFFNNYLDALLEPATQKAVEISKTFIQTVQDIPVWWEQIIWPSMHEVGRLWAEGAITVGQEHIATSITQRVMSLHYPLILDIPRERGVVVVAVSPDELHEIGARMLADLLEIHGWDVYYTGANTPAESIIALIGDLHAQFLCISTTIPSNLRHVADTIEKVRSAELPRPVHIVVGGQAYKSNTDAWKYVGADSFAFSASQIIAHFQGLNVSMLS